MRNRRDKPRRRIKPWWPTTYEGLIKQLMQEHPGYTQAEIEAAVLEVTRRQNARHQQTKETQA